MRFAFMIWTVIFQENLKIEISNLVIYNRKLFCSNFGLNLFFSLVSSLFEKAKYLFISSFALKKKERNSGLITEND